MTVAGGALDIAALRQQTPATAGLLHFNNAGASLAPQAVVDTMLRHLSLEQRLGGYEAAEQAQRQIEHFYHAAASLIGASEQEIAFCSSATEAWQRILMAIPLKHGDRVVITQSEYAGNYLCLLQQAKWRGLQVHVVGHDAAGNIDQDALEHELSRGAALLALTHIPSQSGTVHPAAEIGRLARRYEVPYLLDCAQSVGQLPIDVQTIGCDMLVATGRKYLRGPRGTGFAWVRQSLIPRLQPPVMDLHAARWQSRDTAVWREDARRLESWEHCVAAKIALGRAIDYATTLGLGVIARRVTRLADRLRQQLASIPQVTLHDQGTNLSGLVTFSINGKEAEAVHRHLQRHAINTSVIRRNNTLLDFEPRGLGDINRASVHYYNTEAEVARFCQVISDHCVN